MDSATLNIILKATDQYSAVLKKAEGGMGGLGNAAATAAKTLGIVAAAGGAALASGLVVGIKAAGNLQQAVANISTIKPTIDTAGVFASLNDISTRVPQTASELGDALYNIFSSVEVSQEQALSLVETFAKGAVGASTDAMTFGTAALGVLNAYGLAAGDAGHISDVFFNTVNKGVVTGEELAANLGLVTQSAKMAGVDLDSLGGFIAGVTKEGGPAAQSINNLNNLFLKIGTAEAAKGFHDLGIATADATGKLRPQIDVLSDLKVATAGMTEEAKLASIQKIFPDLQARAGAAVILDQLEFVKAAIEENKTSAGSAEAAYAKMVDTFNSQTKLLGNAFQSILTTLGAEVLPAITPLIKTLAQNLPGAMDTAKKAVGDFATRLKGDLITSLNTFGAKLDDIGASWAPWAAKAGPAGAAVGLALSGVHSASDALQKLLRGDFKGAADDARKALDNFGGAKDVVVQAISDISAGIRNNAVKSLDEFRIKIEDTQKAWAPWAAEAGTKGLAVELALQGVNGAAAAVQKFLQGDFKAGFADASASMDAFRGAAETLSKSLRDDLTPALNGARSAIQTTRDEADKQGAWTDLGKAVDAVKLAGKDFGDVWNGLVGVFKGPGDAAETSGGQINIAASMVSSFTASIRKLAEGAASIAAALKLIGDGFNAIGTAADYALGGVGRLKALLTSGGSLPELASRAGLNIGQNMADGVRQGVASSTPAVKTAGVELGQAAISGASIPELATRAGLSIGENMANGLRQGMTALQRGDAGGGLLTIPQFGSAIRALGFNENTISAICGPIAAQGIAEGLGKSISLIDVESISQKIGAYARGAGTFGTQAFERILSALGIDSRTASFKEAVDAAMSGIPVAISTPLHYFLAQGFDDATQQFIVGNTGTALKAGAEKMTKAAIEGVAGAATFIIPTVQAASQQVVDALSGPLETADERVATAMAGLGADFDVLTTAATPAVEGVTAAVLELSGQEELWKTIRGNAEVTGRDIQTFLADTAAPAVDLATASLEELQSRSGLSLPQVQKNASDAGSDVRKWLLTVGVPAADALRDSFKTTSDKADIMQKSAADLKKPIDDATTAFGGLGGKMGEVATNQATQISFVLQQLREALWGLGNFKDGGLIEGVKKFTDVLKDIPRNIDINIVTHYSSTGSPGGGSSAGGGAPPPGGGGDGGDDGGGDDGGGGGDYAGQPDTPGLVGGNPTHPGESGPGGRYNNPNTGQPYARGGLVTRPTLAMMGEHGAEAILPLSGTYAPKSGRDQGGWSGGTYSVKLDKNDIAAIVDGIVQGMGDVMPTTIGVDDVVGGLSRYAKRNGGLRFTT